LSSDLKKLKELRTVVEAAFNNENLLKLTRNKMGRIT